MELWSLLFKYLGLIGWEIFFIIDFFSFKCFMDLVSELIFVEYFVVELI